MKISVITVCFNSANTIGDTLRSVADQTHPDVEHVIVDGGSRDETVKLAQTLGRSGKVIISEPDRGIYDAMNKGLRLATGDLVGFLNADDVFAHEGVISDIARLAENECSDVIYGDLIYVPHSSTKRTVRHWRSGQFSQTKLHWGWMPPHPTFYVKSALVEKLGVFNSSYKIAADYDFMLRYLREKGLKISYLPAVLVEMKTGGASNRSIRALLLKSREDYSVLRKNRIGGVVTLVCKNFRKLPQLFN